MAPLSCFVSDRGVISHSGGQIKHLILTTGAQLHPLYSFEITRIADGQNLFHSVARLLVRQMECSEHWCEQNDDTTISIIALACACVISIDFNGLCEQEDKSSYHWARHLGWWCTPLLRFGKRRSLCCTSDVTVSFKCSKV